jgi:hypothetical protein
MPEASQQQIDDIKRQAASLQGEERRRYLRGVRDGLDLAKLICDEKKQFDLAADPGLRVFLNLLDKAT